ncbi:MAG: hypothetical protein AAFY43_01750 [Pseudomonadota bacterium]
MSDPADIDEIVAKRIDAALKERLADIEGRLANLEQTSSVDRLNEAVLNAVARVGSTEKAISTAIEAMESLK